ncbi:MAG: hypothetical protein BWK80_35075 [Desulfobacteraceae bacterium IS3]|nr:MAG: hypothetical protein BWK80_35075 [Desulfobacteraceae bacterium IS3]
MNLMIDIGKRIPQPTRYGMLSVDTGEKIIHTGNIVPGSPISVNQPVREIPPNRIPEASAPLADTGGSVPMKTGQKISLNQKVSDISRIVTALKWGAVNLRSVPDVSVFMTDSANKTAEDNFIFYNHPASSCGSILIGSDHAAGIKQHYDATVQINLKLVQSHIQTLAITATIDYGNFGQFRAASLGIIDAAAGKQVLSYSFAENLSDETAIVLAEIYRYKDEWRIAAIGRGFKGGLAALCDNYGIEIEK